MLEHLTRKLMYFNFAFVYNPCTVICALQKVVSYDEVLAEAVHHLFRHSKTANKKLEVQFSPYQTCSFIHRLSLVFFTRPSFSTELSRQQYFCVEMLTKCKEFSEPRSPISYGKQSYLSSLALVKFDGFPTLYKFRYGLLRVQNGSVGGGGGNGMSKQ